MRERGERRHALNVLYGTIGAYDYHDNQIEVGFSVARACWGRGYATQALKKGLDYLTINENIYCVTAGLTTRSQTYDKLIYEYSRQV